MRNGPPAFWPVGAMKSTGGAIWTSVAAMCVGRSDGHLGRLAQRVWWGTSG